ncbi:sigma-70 family RNA polymerase sigma factor [Clostridium sp. MSJ-11]|uniref:Sigma-70 family RNA polymerase sigma factor n=1 Tax=Clostridium mobile TaxID=2841512 RepID=A0ABS6EFV4_9CLOT|nr:sigma-70 family RNA polymerase sigma factor [Clostridium mobile]
MNKDFNLDKLVKRAQNGDDEAYIELFTEHEEAIYRMAYIYVKNEEDALDVVQETAYRSFKSINTLKKSEYFKTWLIKIAISCSIDILRKNKKVVYLEDMETEEIKDEDNYNIHNESLIDMIQSLEEEEKTIVILKYYHDYTFKMISEALSMPLGTVKTILYRALKKIRMEREGDMIYG